MLDKIEREDLLARSRAIGDTIMAASASFAERFDMVGDVRGRGAMCAIELVADRATKEPLGADAMNGIAGRHLTVTLPQWLRRTTASTSRAIAPHASTSTSGRSASKTRSSSGSQ